MTIQCNDFLEILICPRELNSSVAGGTPFILLFGARTRASSPC